MMKAFMTIFLVLLAASGEASIKSYFNHRQGSSYTDPYRNIARSGDNLEQVILDQIKSARKSVFVAVQELRLPLIAKALIEKKNQGLDVRVVLEHDYNFTVLQQSESTESNEHDSSKLSDLKALVDMNGNGKYEERELETRDAIYMLRKAQVPVIDDTSDATRGSGLMHHKFVIVDGRSTVVTTANFTMSCIHGDVLEPSSRGNANSLVLVQSPNFAKLFTQEFLQLWGNGKRGNFGQSKTYRGPQTVTVKGTRLTVQFSPTSRRYQWSESVNGLIAQHLRGARSSVKAALFVFSDQRLSDSLEEANEAGAQIGVLIEPKFAYRYYSELLDMLGVSMRNTVCAYEPDNNPWKNPIMEAGIPFLLSGDVLHHKFAVVDERTVIVGSQNWSDAANHINDETLLVIEDETLADGYTQEYNRLRSRGLTGLPARVEEDIERWEEACAEGVVL